MGKVNQMIIEIKEGDRCPRCMSTEKPVAVHGHYQCPTCKCVVEDCCQGETCQK